MAAASCVQEEKEEKEIQEPSDAIAQGNNVIKWFTLSHIVCRDAAERYFAIHRSRELKSVKQRIRLTAFWNLHFLQIMILVQPEGIRETVVW